MLSGLHAHLSVTLEIHSLVTDRLELVQVLDEWNYELGRNEKFKVGLLVDVTFCGTPSYQWITGGRSVDSRLRVDRE